MKTAYIQSVGGASGDMLLGALLDAGLPLDAVHHAVAALYIPGVEISTTEEIRCEVRGTRALVDVSSAPRYSPQQMLDAVASATDLSESTRAHSTAVLQALFAAEALVHGSDPDDIHLHELGTADTLVDVVGVVHGLEQLGVQRICASPLVLGEATGPRRPGGYSNPAPATLEIIAAAQAPVAPERPFHTNVGELTTPTGAALITTLADEFRQPAMTIHRIGVGAGGKNPPAFPNVLRLWLGETIPSHNTAPTPAIPTRSSQPDHGEPVEPRVDGNPSHHPDTGHPRTQNPSGQPGVTPIRHSRETANPGTAVPAVAASAAPRPPEGNDPPGDAPQPSAPPIIASEANQSRHDAHAGGNPAQPSKNHIVASAAPRSSEPNDPPGDATQASAPPIIASEADQPRPVTHAAGNPTQPSKNHIVASEAQQTRPDTHPSDNAAHPSENPVIASAALQSRSDSQPSAANRPPPTLETVRAAALEAYRNLTSDEPSATHDPNAPFARWQDNVILLETNIDNATGEQLGFAMDQLFAAGALDVWHTPIHMKKNRPGVLLSALAPAELETQLAEAILRHTPTLGIRVRPVGRYVADRDTITVQTEYGPIRIKRKYLSSQITTISPEHDDLAAATNPHNLPSQTVATAVDNNPPTA